MLIGLHGRLGSGKNEAARRLALLRPDVVEVSFAAAMKESAAALLGVSVADLELWKNDASKMVCVGALYDALGFVPFKNKAFTVREFLQRYGTEAHRGVFGKDFWLDQALPLDGWMEGGERVSLAYDDALYVVTDMRFANERQRVLDLGGTTVCIVGPDTDTDTGDHSSEIPLSCDYVVNNVRRDDGFVSLDRNLRKLLDALRLPVAA